MSETTATPARRVLPARERRESAAKRRASSPPKLPTPPAKTAAVPAPPATEPKPKRQYTKRTSLLNAHTPTRNASTPDSALDDLVPTRLAGAKPLPCTTERPQQEGDLSLRDYHSIAESTILLASLHRSRMQWLCDGIFRKYWTKPVKRKGQIEAPPNNPDAKSMVKLGSATITIEPYTFEANIFTVRDMQAVPIQPVYRPHPSPSPAVPSVANQSTAPPATAPPATAPPIALSHPPPPPPPPQPPSNPRTNDPVIQMLAARAATDNRLKELMKVVATSRASPEQLREFQAHINEFTAIAERQRVEQERLAKLAKSTPNKPHGPTYAAAYPTPPRPEHPIKHIVIEFTSPVSQSQSASSDRWLFPDNAVLDLPYAGLEMTCSFFVERKGSELTRSLNTNNDNDSFNYDPDTEYFEPVTMTVRTTQHRVLETIAKSAKTLSEVQKYMQDVMANKTRAPQGFLLHRLPKEKPDSTPADFVDSAVELSTEEEDELRSLYPM